MTVETHVHRARDRVAAERSAVVDRQDAYDAFEERVRSLSPTAAQPEQLSQTVSGAVSTGSGGPDQREAVRTAFAETVVPHVDAGGAVLTSLRSELGEEVALAFAPATNAQFTPGLQKQLLSRIATRRQELSVTETAIERERESVETHLDTVETVTGWLVDADETPLSELGFDALRARHERLDEFQRTCEKMASQRQEALDRTTSRGAQVGVAHRPLVASLYEDFPVDFPVLATATRLLGVCRDAQRTVRAHLTRRG